MSLAGHRVLVVDDNQINRLIVREMISNCGAEMSEAESGAGALMALRQATQAGQPFKIVLLDMRMPVLDGWTVAQRLRERHHRVPTVVMTGAEDAAELCAAIQGDAYLGKPFILDELLTAVAQALNA